MRRIHLPRQTNKALIKNSQRKGGRLKYFDKNNKNKDCNCGNFFVNWGCRFGLQVLKQVTFSPTQLNFDLAFFSLKESNLL